jgi:ribosomal-protein-alanine N-acetyltransferase
VTHSAEVSRVRGSSRDLARRCPWAYLPANVATQIDFPIDGISDGVVRLRPVGYDDVPEILAACEDPLIRRFNSAPSDESEARTWIDGAIDGRPHARAFRLAIADAASGTFLGSIGVPDFDLDTLRAEVGYWLSPSARGRGLATRALRLFCSWAFRELSLARIEAIPEVENRASQRVLDRVGFKCEGVLRSYQVVHGRRRNMCMYSLLVGEMDQASPRSGASA